MGFTQNITRIACAMGLLFFACGASVCRAGCDHTTYAYLDRVAVMSSNKAGAPELHIILLEDRNPLKVSGRVAGPSDRLFDTAGHYNNFLMLGRSNKLEVYDLTDITGEILHRQYSASSCSDGASRFGAVTGRTFGNHRLKSEWFVTYRKHSVEHEMFLRKL